ncbi:MAG: IS66 family transposase [Emticicia sp.]|nr:IS66 family transposase [Emticicia sp.]
MIAQKEETIAQKEETIAQKEETIAQYKEDTDSLKATIAKYERMLFGQKRERFEYPNNQLSLPFEIEPQVLAVVEEAIETKRKKLGEHERKTSHKGRLPLPTHLEIVETIIEPEIDTTDMVLVSQEITDKLGYQPEKFFIDRTIRNNYAPKSSEGSFAIATLPEFIIEKGIPTNQLVSQILVDKYIDHLPLYRIKARFARNKIDIKDSTINGWVSQSLSKLEILYDFLKAQMKALGYLQLDETTLKVLDSTLKGKTHLGYYWAFNCPINNILFFEYNKGREANYINEALKDFKGYIQTDGYDGYAALARKPQITQVACMAHARRKFDEALLNDKERSQKAILYIQALYHIEAKAREKKMTFEQRKELRLQESLPIINQLGAYIAAESKNVLPKSKIGLAFQYCTNRWDALSAYLNDGILEIDNNLIENAIRPIAIGRKNYLFAGSHDAAQKAAMIYTFFGICKKHNINPTDWLNFVFQNIQSTSIQNLANLLPQNFK